MPKLPTHIAARIANYDEEAAMREDLVTHQRAYAEMLKTWRDARYATESRREHFWSPKRWFVVDGSPNWSLGPYKTEEAAEDRRIALDRSRLLILRSERV